MQPIGRWVSALVLSAGVFCGTGLDASLDRCTVCGGEFGDTIYTALDRVTRERKQICRTCSTWPDLCFICGLPARKHYTQLADGRFLCARDAKGAVLDTEEARRLCEQVKDDLDKLFSRFLAFPGNKVEIGIVDRVNLLAFKVPGNDQECPNLLGYIQPTTNHGQVRYSMSLLSALPRAEFKAVCAHEYSHAWVFENVSAERRKTLGHDAHEGFCELVAYLLMNSESEEEAKKNILRNPYTRGQIDLFIAAEQRYGFNDIVDWISYGADARLDKDDLGKVRSVQSPPRAPVTPMVFLPADRPTSEPETLVLRGISLARKQALALINDRTLAVGETGRIRAGKTNLLVRCLAIGDHSVRIQLLDSGEAQELRLRPRSP